MQYYTRKPGDWDCPECNFSNFARRTRCKDCGSYRNDESYEQRDNGRRRDRGNNRAMMNRRPGDWDCDCGELNFASRTRCRSCYKNKPNDFGYDDRFKARTTYDEWTCDRCNTSNYDSRQSCRNCNKARERDENQSGVGRVGNDSNNNNKGNNNTTNSGNDGNDETEAKDDIVETPVDQKFQYLIILDFEATCDDKKKNPSFNREQEIIEWPCIIVDLSEGKILDENSEDIFHHYIKPKLHADLTEFCTELTGITRETVEGGKDIEVVCTLFDKWCSDHHLTVNSACVVTCGDWDLRSMWPRQANLSSLETPNLFDEWINIKKLYYNHGAFTRYPRGMMKLLEFLGLDHIGRHHSGIDDVRNLARCALRMYEKGVLFDYTHN